MTMARQLRTACVASLVVMALCLVLPLGRVCCAEPDVDALAAEEQLERQQERAAVARARELAADLFYDFRVSFKDFQPSAVKEISQHFGYGWVSNLGMEMAVDKRVATLDGILVDPQKGLFIMADPDINLEAVAKIELRTDSGDTYPVEVLALYPYESAWLMRASGFSVERQMPDFADDIVEDGAEVLLADVSRFGDKKDIRVRGLKLRSYLSHEGELEIFVLGDAARPRVFSQDWPVANLLLFDSEGSLAGVVVWSMLVRTAGRANYFTQWPKPEDGLSKATFDQIVDSAVAEAERYTRGVKFRFRKEEGRGSSRYYAVSRYSQAVPEDEWTAYGLSVDPHLVFVPTEIEREKVERIEKVLLLEPEGEVPAEFVGVFKEFGGMIVRSSRALECPDDLWAARDIADMTMFVDVSVKHRFGAKDAIGKYNSFFGTRKGYKDKEFRAPLRPVLPGSLILSNEGRLCGFATNEKRYESVVSQRVSFRSGLSGGETGGLRCFTFADMKDRFADPEAYLDTSVRVKRMQERKELAWLGVEFQPITPELAKKLEVEKETRDGKYGLLVSLVYEGSPAQKIGIQQGDLLLKIEEKEKAGEHLLRIDRDYDRLQPYDVPFYAESGALVNRSWFNRRNSLTGLLTRLGPGTAAVLTFSHDGRIRSAEFTVEKAPPDLNSAEKYKSEWTGLTVKDVTYEVRRILRLADGFEGLIVYEVEPGSPAAVGQIVAMEFIEEINRKQVGDIASFRETVEELVSRGARSATFKVRHLDQSRFVEVQLQEPKRTGPAIEDILRQIPGLSP